MWLEPHFNNIFGVFMDNTILRRTVLFRDMSEGEIRTCLKELRSQEKTYKKGTVILHAGEETDRMGLVLDGSVTIESNDVWGNLNTVSLQEHSVEFDIPFDRQQLADYLNLERTNMSKELGKMQREGIIECRKNHFKLINPRTSRRP